MPDFPKTARLRHSVEFKRTLDSGRKVICRHMVLFGRRREAADQNEGLRLGLIVSKKVGESVSRNKVKRHLREGFRHLSDQPDLAVRSLDLVVIARHGAAEAGSAVLQAELQRCLRRLLKAAAEVSP